RRDGARGSERCRPCDLLKMRRHGRTTVPRSVASAIPGNRDASASLIPGLSLLLVLAEIPRADDDEPGRIEIAGQGARHFLGANFGDLLLKIRLVLKGSPQMQIRTEFAGENRVLASFHLELLEQSVAAKLHFVRRDAAVEQLAHFLDRGSVDLLDD